MGNKVDNIDKERNPHREICCLCHEVSRVGFRVSDKIWELAVHSYYRESIICLSCFTRLADERYVEWDKDIELYPISRKKYDKDIKGKIMKNVSIKIVDFFDDSIDEITLTALYINNELKLKGSNYDDNIDSQIMGYLKALNLSPHPERKQVEISIKGCDIPKDFDITKLK